MRALLLTTILLSACGPNAFEPAEHVNPVDEAIDDMENNDPAAAIALLAPEHQKKPSDDEVSSVLASAYLQKRGVDVLDLAVNLADRASSGQSSASGDPLSGMFSFLPAPSSETLADVSTAVTLLQSLTTVTSADKIKLSIATMAYTGLLAKTMDSNGDGKLDISEILSMPDATATQIVQTIAQAALSAIQNSGNTTNDQASAAIAQVQADIAKEPGSTPAEQLRNYLQAKNPSS